MNRESGTYIEVGLCQTEPGEDGAFYILAEWKFGGLHYALWGKASEGEKEYADPDVVAKAAVGIAENITSAQKAE